MVDSVVDTIAEKADEIKRFQYKEPERPGVEGHLECYATVLDKGSTLAGGPPLASNQRIGYWMRVRLDDGQERNDFILEEIYNDIQLGERSLLLVEKGIVLDFGERLGEDVSLAPLPQEEALAPETEYPVDDETEEEWLGPLDVRRVPCVQEPNEPAEPLVIRIAENVMDLQLPGVYRDFLLQMNGAKTNFARLYSAEEMMKRYKELELETEAPGFLSIGNDNIVHELLMKAEPNTRKVLFVQEDELSSCEEPDFILPRLEEWIENGMPNPWE